MGHRHGSTFAAALMPALLAAGSGDQPSRGAGRLKVGTTSLLGPRDVLGGDVYTGVGVSRAADCWPVRAATWLSLATSARRQVWITELQAEPWESTPATLDKPISTSPTRITAEFAGLRRLGYREIILWGSEYWLLRSRQGDERWLQTVAAMLRNGCQVADQLVGR